MDKSYFEAKIEFFQEHFLKLKDQQANLKKSEQLVTDEVSKVLNKTLD